MRHLLVDSLYASAAWFFGYGVTFYISNGSSNSGNYSILVGWWFAAYVVAVLNLRGTSAILMVVIYFLLITIAAFWGKAWFYHDVDNLSLGGRLVVGLLQAVFFGSPVIFSGLVLRFLRLCVFLRQKRVF